MKVTTLTTGRLPCGLYRTTLPLVHGTTVTIPEKRLVSLHNHKGEKRDRYGVFLPIHNRFNKWTFSDKGVFIADDYAKSLMKLLPEGFYILVEDVPLSGGLLLAQRTLVQLGYAPDAVALLFPFRFVDNSFVFPTRGYGFEPTRLPPLERPNFRLPPREVTRPDTTTVQSTTPAVTPTVTPKDSSETLQ